MQPAARIAAAAEILDRVLEGEAAEKALTSWARGARFAGSKDRAAIRDHVFDALRCMGSFALLGGARTGRGLMAGMLRDSRQDPAGVFTGEGHAPAPLTEAETGQGLSEDEAGWADIPDWVRPDFEASLGDDALAVANVLRARAPVQIRVNRRLTTRGALQTELADEGITAQPMELAKAALEVTEGARKLQRTAAYEDGRFEMQDAGSQAICEAVPLADGQRVLDYCAGGGGKSLALGARAELRLHAHDAAPQRMKDLPARARRAGLRVTLLDSDDLAAHGPFDLVFCDVPCSGSGAWRRAPEGKWRLTRDRLEELTAIQAQILYAAAPLVAPGGRLAYATCSLFDAENAAQIQAFLNRTPGWRQDSERRLTPLDGGDGFYVSQLLRD
ncbi:RsmB/NOP family class I SAM-dependent RNA methyltransferase [Pseudooceanicola marinus]|uniref:RsmB/NOP family class I SAM-dependent RNA methyltransferase n=1 Tax=Pseudooceanicola marinus TaxID=396013 RepID=UPI001CD1AD0A|nr:RsmB/NOP family class I SAM-dependent RNA methyltransferase [Pseudooceanicola marinus]MCA1334243.1 RsmB/NOP family class I SAM-dependent RNA methyltransferase [Pseudooceanicola marinus]